MYQPVISEANIRKLYRLKLEKRKPMTKLIDRILEDYFQNNGAVNTSPQKDESNREAQHSLAGEKSESYHQPAIRFCPSCGKRFRIKITK